MHDRLSVHAVTFYGTPLAELGQHWATLGVRRLSLIDTQLFDPALAPLIDAHGYQVEAVYHLFDGADGLSRVIDAAAAHGARVIYLLTGGRRGLSWERAADRFCRSIAPCRAAAEQAGVALAIETASALYADIHFAHTLRDTITLAERAEVGLCLDVFHCWAEADFDELTRRALPRTELIQLSDYVLGDRALPARAVPGDGAIPLAEVLTLALAGGYPHGFDLELIGPRIDAEGPLAAARRAGDVVGALLTRLGV